MSAKRPVTSPMPLRYGRGARRVDTTPVTALAPYATLHGRFGRLPLADVLEPARASADGGFPASPLLAAAVPQLAGLAEAGDYLDGGPLREGDLVRRPAVARALAGIGAGGRAAFYE